MGRAAHSRSQRARLAAGKQPQGKLLIGWLATTQCKASRNLAAPAHWEGLRNNTFSSSCSSLFSPPFVLQRNFHSKESPLCVLFVHGLCYFSPQIHKCWASPHPFSLFPTLVSSLSSSVSLLPHSFTATRLYMSVKSRTHKWEKTWFFSDTGWICSHYPQLCPFSCKCCDFLLLCGWKNSVEYRDQICFIHPCRGNSLDGQVFYFWEMWDVFPAWSTACMPGPW